MGEGRMRGKGGEKGRERGGKGREVEGEEVRGEESRETE